APSSMGKAPRSPTMGNDLLTCLCR
ncbi:hypothetical protein A2U01_0101314, partial [Trifolium medium]|nr:hypothetical protein [Trifolium medium]